MKFYQSTLLNNYPNLIHRFSTREDGNLAFHVNDIRENVINAHDKLALSLSYKRQNLIHMKQIHSSLVHIVEENDNFDNPHKCDALITNRADTPLMVMVADCSPILFYDDKTKTIAVAHAGRAGAFKNIVQETLESFKKDFGANAADIIVSIGASIGVCCYEVGEEINAEASRVGLDYAMKKKGDSYFLNISKILQTQLLNAGVLLQNIEFNPDCTSCHNEKYFSYRANSKDGRFAGIISL